MITPMKSETYWAHLLEDHFGLSTFSPKKAKRWFMEIRSNVPGWMVHPDEDDPVTSDNGYRINNELCEVIRHIKDLDTVPLKHEKGDGKRTKPLVKDIELWVHIYRKHKRKEQSGHGDSYSARFVEATKGLIQHCIQTGQHITASVVAVGNPYAADTEDLIMFMSGLGNRGLSDDEQTAIDDFCREIGFNPYEVQRMSPSYQEYLSRYESGGHRDVAGELANKIGAAQVHYDEEEEDMFL